MNTYTLRPFQVFAAAIVTATLCALASNANADPKVLKKVPPEFPEEATRRNISDGVIKARVAIDGQGAVTNVEIVEATPVKAKVFAPAAVAALGKWKFEGTGKGETFELKLVFSQE